MIIKIIIIIITMTITIMMTMMMIILLCRDKGMKRTAVRDCTTVISD